MKDLKDENQNLWN